MNADWDPPLAGDCWSLQSRRGGPELSPPVLLIRRLDALNTTWHALPLFMEAGMAGPFDVKLEPEPFFLNGESWCALEQVSEIHVSRLYGKLGTLEQPLFRKVRDAFEGGICDLRRGAQMMTESIDPRTEFHMQLAEGLRFCGAATFSDAVSSAIRIVVSRSGDRIIGMLEDLQKGLTSVLQPEQIQVPVYRGASVDQPEPVRWKVKLPDSGKEISVECAPIGEGYHLMILGDDIRSVTCSSAESGDIPLTPLGETWTTLQGEPLMLGTYKLHVNQFTLELQLQAN